MAGKDVNMRNNAVVILLSRYLDRCPAAITAEMMAAMRESMDMTAQEAYAQLLAALCSLDAGGRDRELFQDYFLPMVEPLDAGEYEQDPYYRNVRVPELQLGRWETKTLRYQPYEAFVAGELRRMEDGRILPHVGFFEREFPYPAVLEDDREWMTITPKEINTMRAAVEAARGRVLTYGLGLGYYAYMVSEKEAVESVTVVEREQEVIDLFEAHILPQFSHGDKLRIVRDDAFRFAESRMGSGGYDLVFTDLWHDASDGLELYGHMKKLERFSPGSKFLYWVEETMGLYL